MKTLSCADIGIKNCNFVARGNSDDDVIAKAMEHGISAHADKMMGMDEEKMTSMMKSKIKNA